MKTLLQLAPISAQTDTDPGPVRGNQCPRCHLTMPLSGVCDCEE